MGQQTKVSANNRTSVLICGLIPDAGSGMRRWHAKTGQSGLGCGAVHRYVDTLRSARTQELIELLRLHFPAGQVCDFIDAFLAGFGPFCQHEPLEQVALVCSAEA